jgi:hypothetical protein
MVCVRGGEGGPLYSANRSVPAPNKYGNIVHRLGVDRIKFPTKDEAGWRQKGFGRPTGAASRTSFRSRHYQVGPQLVYVDAGALFVSFLCQMGPF